MKLLIQSAIIFFGTLMAAAVVALGEPARAVVETARDAAPRHDVRGDQERIDLASTRPGFSVR